MWPWASLSRFPPSDNPVTRPDWGIRYDVGMNLSDFGRYQKVRFGDMADSRMNQ